MNVEQIKKLVPELGEIPLYIVNIAELAVSAVSQGYSLEMAQMILNGAAAGWYQAEDGPVLGIQIDALLLQRMSEAELRAILLHEIGHIRLGHLPSLEELFAGVGLRGTFEGREMEADMFALENGADILDLCNGIKIVAQVQLAQTIVAYKAIKGEDMTVPTIRRVTRETLVDHKVRFRALMALYKQF
jgi:hypothetical protein